MDIVQRLRAEPDYRAGFKDGLKEGYQVYQESGGTMSFKNWTLNVSGPEIWNELFQAKGSSYPVSLRGLTRADGRRVTRGY